jgi:DNA-binding PadR family transcriptional regulator
MVLMVRFRETRHMQPATSEKRQPSGPLRGALLAVLVSEREQPLSGYRLTTLVERRLGPAWRVTRQSVYGTLERLEDDGLVSATLQPGLGGPSAGRKVYAATDAAESAVEAWIAGPIDKEPVRIELQARIAMSGPEHASQLLIALDVYERECFAMLRKTSEAEVPLGSWRGLTMNLTRIAVDEGLQAELRWITMARRWIEDFVAESRARPAD